VIEIASLTEADRGRWVRLSREPYTNPGRILRWNDSHIFILWHRGQFEKSLDHTQRAVAPEDLEFLDDDPQGEPQKLARERHRQWKRQAKARRQEGFSGVLARPWACSIRSSNSTRANRFVQFDQCVLEHSRHVAPRPNPFAAKPLENQKNVQEMSKQDFCPF